MDAFASDVLPQIPDARLWMVSVDAPNGEGVDVLGRINDDELADRYRRAWIFCLPSSYEGFGVPYIEAMASGTAIVATPNPGAKEVLGSGRFGEIVSPQDLGSALARLLRDRTRRQVLEAASVEESRRYDWEVVASQYEDLYELVISTGCRRKANVDPMASGTGT
jgi:glycosyltransferase involved in cell wall biosynthesis